MKTVKIEIEVEVPDWAEWVAIDGNGEIACYAELPVLYKLGPSWVLHDVDSRYKTLCVANWQDTLTEVT